MGQTQSQSQSQSSQPDIPVLLITTHGYYGSNRPAPKEKSKRSWPDSDYFQSQMNLAMIHAVVMDVCNYLDPDESNKKGELIFEAVNNSKITDIVNGSEIIKDILISNDEALKDPKRVAEEDPEQGIPYDRNANKAYEIKPFQAGQDILDKTFIVNADEVPGTYWRSITFIQQDYGIRDIMKEYYTENKRAWQIHEDREIKLSEILTHLQSKGVDNLIIADLSCASVYEPGVTGRGVRYAKYTQGKTGKKKSKNRYKKKKKKKKNKNKRKVSKRRKKVRKTNKRKNTLKK